MSQPCKNSFESGCRCWQHDMGLAAYVPEERREAYLKALTGFVKRTEPRRLQAVPDAPQEPDCTGSMVCACKRCKADKVRRLNAGSQDRRQPWEPRKAA